MISPDINSVNMSQHEKSSLTSIASLLVFIKTTSLEYNFDNTLPRRRIRSIQKLIRVGSYEVVVVLRVDEDKGMCGEVASHDTKVRFHALISGPHLVKWRKRSQRHFELDRLLLDNGPGLLTTLIKYLAD